MDITPNWPEKKQFLTGSLDGIVKQWSVEVVNNRVKVKETHCHEVHKTEHEVSIVKTNTYDHTYVNFHSTKLNILISSAVSIFTKTIIHGNKLFHATLRKLLITRNIFSARNIFWKCGFLHYIYFKHQ